MTLIDELAPCPFCGFNSPHFKQVGGVEVVICDDCGAEADPAYWNRRAATKAEGAQAPVASNVTHNLCRMLVERDAKGRAKYGATLDRTDLTREQWLQHLTEELLDAAGYAQALMTAPPSLPDSALVQAIEECRERMAGSLTGPDAYCDWIEQRAREIGNGEQEPPK